MTRGKSQAVKDASEYMKLHPEISPQVIALKFGLNIATVYRVRAEQKAKEQIHD